VRAIVIGAGLAGLACAHDLAAGGASVQVLEAADAVGGRMRTDSQAGFLLDRGFQVFNTSYPQVRRRMDLRALQLCPFAPGFILHADGGRIRFADPTRRPGQQADMLLGRLAGPRDLAALAIFSARDMLGPPSWILGQPDEPTAIALTAAGISRGLIERLFRPFLSGIFLEDDLDTSSRFFHLVWRSMLRGTLCLPRAGIQAVPAQLAASLPDGTIQLGTEVTRLTDTGVLLADGTDRAADAVVVATGSEAAALLLPDLSVPPARTVTTLYHAAADSPLAEPVLLVDSGREVLHTSVLTEVTRSYATDGRALISTSVLGGDAGPEPAVRARLAQLYETDTSGWEHLSTCVVRGALPAMTAPHQLTRRCPLGPGRFVCGDYRATGSVQGALASGARAAREVLASRPAG
jgi:phytoene dehydrogenase-like protein